MGKAKKISRTSKLTSVKSPSFHYLPCRKCGKETRCSTDAVAVTCSHCTAYMAEWPVGSKQKNTGPARPRGWAFMKEFVDEEGNVFHKGIEQPELFGTLKPTPPKPKNKKKSKLTIRQREAIKMEKELAKRAKAELKRHPYGKGVTLFKLEKRRVAAKKYKYALLKLGNFRFFDKTPKQLIGVDYMAGDKVDFEITYDENEFKNNKSYQALLIQVK